MIAMIAAALVAAQPVPAPHGAIAFCARNQSFCEPHEAATAPLSAMPVLEKWNMRVNNALLPAPLDTPEQRRAENSNWRIVAPGGLADCADYAWTKYELLAFDGVPEGAMRVAVVHRSQDEPGMDHAVLLVRVAGVEVVLDSLTPVIWPASSEQWNWKAVMNPTDPANPWAWIKPDGAPQ